MDELKSKVDLLIAHAVQTNERLDSINENLSEHMRRTEVAETRLEVIENEFKPVLKHFRGIEWTARAVIGVVTFGAGIVKIIELLKR
jgi:hypothetical protein